MSNMSLQKHSSLILLRTVPKDARAMFKILQNAFAQIEAPKYHKFETSLGYVSNSRPALAY